MEEEVELDHLNLQVNPKGEIDSSVTLESMECVTTHQAKVCSSGQRNFNDLTGFSDV
jgi:hypothetical protein